MSKLKSIGRPEPMDVLERDPMRCCRWCHWCVKQPGAFGSFVCVKNNLLPLVTMNLVHDLIEEGKLSEVVEEALHSCPEGEREFKSQMVSAALSVKSNMSRKAQGAYESDFDTALEQYLDMRLKDVLLDMLETMLTNYEEKVYGSTSEGAEIEDPTEFWCKDFW